MQRKLLHTIFLIYATIAISCNMRPTSEKVNTPPIVSNSSPSVKKPLRDDERIDRGKEIFTATVKKFKFDYQKPIVSGMCVDVVVPFPKSAWNKLAKKEKVDVALYAEDTIYQVKGKPAEFVEMPETAPLYGTCLGNIAKLCSTCWRIEAGSVVTIDGDTNIGPDAEVVVDGKSIGEFRRLNDK